MKKSTFNFINDIVMFVLMAIVAGIGLLIKYVLLRGSERWIIYERNVDLTIFGWDRHQWGTIHLIFSLVLISLLILHIILHWKSIRNVYSRLVKNRQGRLFGGIAILCISALIVVLPFILKVEVVEMTDGRGRHNAVNSHLKEAFPKSEDSTHALSNEHVKKDHEAIHKSGNEIKVQGFMTLLEVSNKNNIPCNYLKSKLNIPKNISNSKRLGHLRKEYGFRISEVEKIIRSYQKTNL